MHQPTVSFNKTKQINDANHYHQA